MSKRLRFLVGLLAVCGLVACRSTAVPTSTATPAPPPTSTQVAPTATVVKEATPKPTATPRGEDTASDSTQEADMEPPWQIPEVGEGDWTKGPDDAPLVVVEYSDFQ